MLNRFKNHMKNIFLYTFLTAVIFSCTSDLADPACLAEDIKPVPFEVLDRLRLKNIDESKDKINLIIRSEKDYRKFVINQSGELPQVDFSKHILLCGQKRYMHCIHLKGVDVIDKCGKIEHQIHVLEKICGAIEYVYYFTLIPAGYAGNEDITFKEVLVKVEDVL